MTAVAHPAPAAPIRVAAGTTAGEAVREAGLPGRGDPAAVVVVRDPQGRLRDLSWVPDADVDVVPVAGRDQFPTAHAPVQRAPDATTYGVEGRYRGACFR